MYDPSLLTIWTFAGREFLPLPMPVRSGKGHLPLQESAHEPIRSAQVPLERHMCSEVSDIIWSHRGNFSLMTYSIKDSHILYNNAQYGDTYKLTDSLPSKPSPARLQRECSSRADMLTGDLSFESSTYSGICILLAFFMLNNPASISQTTQIL